MDGVFVVKWSFMGERSKCFYSFIEAVEHASKIARGCGRLVSLEQLQ